jgi:hypothetical protein
MQELATRLRAASVGGGATPAVVRAALARIAPAERDAWADLLLGLDGIPADGPELPSGCVPYLPCLVDVLVRAIDEAGVDERDVFVDVGAGVGRAAALVRLLTGATAIGLEVQPHLARMFRELAARLNLPRLSVVEGDAALTTAATRGSVYFFNCPFSGERLGRVLDSLEPVARAQPIRVCCVDVPLPARPWLAPLAPPSRDLAVYRSKFSPRDERPAGPAARAAPCARAGSRARAAS